MGSRRLLISLLASVAVTVSCNPDSCLVSSACGGPIITTIIEITPNPVPKLKVSATVQLTATVRNNSNPAVTWSVLSGPSFATVNQTGLVNGVAAGVAVVLAQSAADPNAKAAVA